MEDEEDEDEDKDADDLEIVALDRRGREEMRWIWDDNSLLVPAIAIFLLWILLLSLLPFGMRETARKLLSWINKIRKLCSIRGIERKSKIFKK